jgi:hypothetical protein
MHDNFDAGKQGDAAHQEDLQALSDKSDEVEINDLPPAARNPSFLAGLRYISQRLPDAGKHVSRATLQSSAQMDAVQASEEAALTSDGEFELEISDLPPSQRSHYLLLRLHKWGATLSSFKHISTRAAVPPTRRRLRRYAGRAGVSFGLCLVLLVLLIDNAPGLRTRLIGFLAPTPTSTSSSSLAFVSQNSSSVIIINPRYGTPGTSQNSPGPLPTTCPQSSNLQYFTTPLDPPGLGASSIWISGFTGPSAVLNDLAPINPQATHASWPFGWYEPLTIFIQKGYSGPVTLRGSSQAGGAPIWLSRGDPTVLNTSLTLSQNDGSAYNQDGPWEMTTITLAVPAAGCYTLQASWGNNQWIRYFAAGA